MVVATIIMMVVTSIIAAITFALGWFVYGGIGGGLAILLLCVVYAALSVLSVIPFVGFIAQAYVLLNYAWPIISEYTSMEAGLLTTIIFVIYMFSGIIITVNTTMMLMRY